MAQDKFEGFCCDLLTGFCSQLVGWQIISLQDRSSFIAGWGLSPHSHWQSILCSPLFILCWRRLVSSVPPEIHVLSQKEILYPTPLPRAIIMTALQRQSVKIVSSVSSTLSIVVVNSVVFQLLMFSNINFRIVFSFN